MLEKRNYLVKLINIPTKAEERSSCMIQISFRTQNQNIKTGRIWNPCQNSQLLHDPLCFPNLQIHSIYCKNPQSVRFLISNLSIRKPVHPSDSKDVPALNYCSCVTFVFFFFCNFFFLLHYVNDNITISRLTLNNIIHTMNYYDALLTQKKRTHLHYVITIN